MDKYQEFAIKQCKIVGDKTLKSFEWDLNKIVLEQNENYNLANYNISICHASIEKVEYKIHNKLFTAKRVGESQHDLEIDFNNKINSIKVYFNEEIVEPVDIKIEYLNADKCKYDEKLKIQQQKELTEKAKVVVKTGDCLINVNFQPVSENYSYSKVELYSYDEKTKNQLMAKYKTAEDVYFYSISGIAYGKYTIVLIQYDKENNEIYRSDYIPVSLKEPNYSGKNVVTPRRL